MHLLRWPKPQYLGWLALSLAVVSVALGSSFALATVAQITYLADATGAPASFNAINGSGFTTAGTVYFDGTNGKGDEYISYPNGHNASDILRWNDNQIIFQVPTDMVGTTQSEAGDIYRQVYGVTVNSSNSINFDASSYPAGTTVDVKPHGNFSTSTDFCLSCHMVHPGNTGAKQHYAYALLGSDTNVVEKNPDVVTQVCENCHVVGGVGPNLPVGYKGPAGGFAGVESVATTAHFQVYKNGPIHQVGTPTVVPDSSITHSNLGYLRLNTTAYQSASYVSYKPPQLYCGSCHSPHGNYSANAWLGWDAAQFSENYGNNYDSNVRATGALPNSTGVDYWRYFIKEGNGGTQPLTNALLIDNPGHQNGIGNGDSNPNVPSSLEVIDRYSSGGTSLNFEPYIEVANTDYIGGWVDPLFDVPTSGGNPVYTGATNDTLSNFCMGCHDLNGGKYSGDQGHPAHPLQGTLSPDNAGINQIYPTDQSGAYGHILDGCTDCHGAPGIVSGSFASGFSLVSATPSNDPSFYTDDYPYFDFPHSQATPDYELNDDILLKAGPDGLCLSCHDSKPMASSLP